MLMWPHPGITYNSALGIREAIRRACQGGVSMSDEPTSTEVGILTVFSWLAMLNLAREERISVTHAGGMDLIISSVRHT